MRYPLVALMMALCVVASAGYAGAPVAAEPIDPIDTILPADSIAVVELFSVGKVTDAMAKSPLGRTLSASEAVQGLVEASWGSARVASMLLTGTRLDSLDEIFSGNAAAALLELPGQEKGTLPAVVIVAHVGDKGARLEEIIRTRLRPALEELAPDVLFEVKPHDGIAVTEFHQAKGPTAAYALVGSFFVLGSQSGVVKLIDSVKQATPTLSTHADYKAAKKLLAAETGAMAWVNTRTLLGALRPRIEANQRLQRLLAALGGEGIRSIGWGMQFAEQTVRDRVFVQMDSPRTGALNVLPDDLKVPFGGAQFVPRDFTAYATVDLGPGEQVWAGVQAAIRDAAGAQALERVQQFIEIAIEQQLGFSVRDGLIAPLGGELFVAVDARKWGELIATAGTPNSRQLPFILGAKLANREAIEKTIQQILRSNLVWQQLGVETIAAKYNNVDTHVLRIPDRPDLSVSYAILNDYLIVAWQQDVLKAAIDAAVSKDSLASRSDHTTALKLVPEGGSLKVFVDAKGITPGLITGIEQGMVQPLKQLAPELRLVAEKLDPVMIRLGATKEGVLIDMASPVGSPVILLLAAVIGDSANRTWAALATERMQGIGKALETYRAQNGTYPRRLTELVPKYITELPDDPFSKPEGTFTYSPGPPSQTPDGKTVYTAGWILISVGPDNKLDVDIVTFDPAKWNQMQAGDNDAELRKQLYRFRPRLYKDERGGGDEGDIVLTGPQQKP